ncbi:MAG: hypothetical protein WCR04_12495 [Fibrobacteraceae bacterium]
MSPAIANSVDFEYGPFGNTETKKAFFIDGSALKKLKVHLIEKSEKTVMLQQETD